MTFGIFQPTGAFPSEGSVIRTTQNSDALIMQSAFTAADGSSYMINETDFYNISRQVTWNSDGTWAFSETFSSSTNVEMSGATADLADSSVFTYSLQASGDSQQMTYTVTTAGNHWTQAPQGIPTLSSTSTDSGSDQLQTQFPIVTDTDAETTIDTYTVVRNTDQTWTTTDHHVGNEHRNEIIAGIASAMELSTTGNLDLGSGNRTRTMSVDNYLNEDDVVESDDLTLVTTPDGITTTVGTDTVTRIGSTHDLYSESSTTTDLNKTGDFVSAGTENDQITSSIDHGFDDETYAGTFAYVINSDGTTIMTGAMHSTSSGDDDTSASEHDYADTLTASGTLDPNGALG